MAREMRSPKIPLHPHESSLFLSGKVASKLAKFLLDTGCTTNLLSRQFFDTLGAQIRNRLEPYEGDHGTLAEGSCITSYGIIGLPGSVRDQTIQETFIVGQLHEDAIIGMPFLQRHGCRIDFGKSVILMGDKELACIDKFGCPLTGEEPIVRTCTMPGQSRGTVRHQVDGGNTSRRGVVESAHPSVSPARSSNQLTRRGKTLVTCLHPPFGDGEPTTHSYTELYSLCSRR